MKVAAQKQKMEEQEAEKQSKKEKEEQQKLVKEEEENDDEYHEFDSDNNKRRISRSDAMSCTYHVVCQYYEAKGWEHNNRWTENSDELPMTED